MKREMFAASLAGLTFLLMGFTPPEVVRPAQQVPPKTWIPESKANDPVIVAPDLPKPPAAPALTPATLMHAPAGVTCPADATSTKAKREFVEAYRQAVRATREGRWVDAVSHVEEAAPFAADGQQWSALEQVRVAAFNSLGDTANEIASIEAALAVGCMSGLTQKNYEQMLPDLRNKSSAPQ